MQCLEREVNYCKDYNISHLIKVLEAYDEKRQAYYNAWHAFYGAHNPRYKAYEAYCVAQQVYDTAGEACKPELIKLHKELCLNCLEVGRLCKKIG